MYAHSAVDGHLLRLVLVLLVLAPHGPHTAHERQQQAKSTVSWPAFHISTARTRVGFDANSQAQLARLATTPNRQKSRDRQLPPSTCYPLHTRTLALYTTLDATLLVAATVTLRPTLASRVPLSAPRRLPGKVASAERVTWCNVRCCLDQVCLARTRRLHHMASDFASFSFALEASA